MRSVMVTKFVPYPANSGGKLRSLAIVRRLARLGEVVLCCFDDDTADADGLRAMGIDVRTVPWRPHPLAVARGVARTKSGSAGRFWDPDLAQLVTTALAEKAADVLQVEYSQLTPYLSLGDARLKVLDFHNVESHLARSFARSSNELKAWLAYPESVILRRLERIGAEQADVVVAVSQKDKERMPGHPREMLVCPNGWDPTEVIAPALTPTAVFVALLGWRPNSDAALWLVQKVWPLVRAEVPGARLLLVGRDPSPDVVALAADDVIVTGTVPEVRPYLAEARVATAPLLSGGGTRLKVLEALDAGRPLVSTSVGIDGLDDLVGHGAVVADSPQEFARAMITYLNDPQLAQEAGAKGADAVRTRYSWDVTLDGWLQRISA
jgi:glycosyltransferase involved in cell wall biosynthesis